MLRSYTLIAFSICVLTSSLHADTPAPAPTVADAAKSIFNGSDLTGWDGDTRLWSVRDGVIHGETTEEVSTKGNTFLIWKGGIVKDFTLHISFRCSATNNSGIQYRSEHLTEGKRATNDWVVKGYQHEIRNENTLPNVSSFIYDEKGKRGRISVVGQRNEWNEDGSKVLENDYIDQAGFEKLMKIDDWNDVVIVAKGNHIQHYLNGQLVMDFTDNHPELSLSEGILALQLHAGKPMWTEFKDIKLTEH